MTIAEDRREFAEEVVRRLRKAGFQSLWAGGCVRDLILGQTPSDYDVATDARPEQVMAALPFHTIPVGISFGVVRVNHPRRRGTEVEVATFRNDGAYVDGRRPESVSFSTPQEDAERRDFTINGMFFDPISQELIDYVGGREDLDRRILRAIGEPMARFREDKLRLLRAVRFAARFGLSIHPITEQAIRSMAAEVVLVSPERISQEFKRMLIHPSRTAAMSLAWDLGLINAVLPELSQSGIAPHLPDDKLTWAYTLRLLGFLPESPTFPLAFAALLSQVDSRVADAISRRLRLSNADRDRITWLVASGSLLNEAERLPTSRLKRILALPGVNELLSLHRAKALASSGDLSHVEFCVHFLEKEPAGPINPPPLLTGDDLMRHGLTPGPHFATILDQVRDAQLEGLIDTKDQALNWLNTKH